MLFLVISYKVTSHAGMHQKQRIQILLFYSSLDTFDGDKAICASWAEVSMRCSTRDLGKEKQQPLIHHLPFAEKQSQVSEECLTLTSFLITG